MTKNQLISADSITRQEIVAAKEQFLWERASSISLFDAIQEFLDTLTHHTKRAYSTAFNQFFEGEILNTDWSLQQFALLNLETILDSIKTTTMGSEATKQSRSATFVAFTAFMQRRSNNLIKKAVACKENGKQTFKKIRNKAVTTAFSEKDLKLFLGELRKMSVRDYLFAKCILQGAKRINEVSAATANQIDWVQNQITFKQSKSDVESHTVITFPQSYMNELKQYLQGRATGYIFQSRNGTRLQQSHAYRSFVGASVNAGLSNRVTPHTLRASSITLFAQKGYSADEIAKVSGHVELKMISYYNKSDMADNPTKQMSLI